MLFPGSRMSFPNSRRLTWPYNRLVGKVNYPESQVCSVSGLPTIRPGDFTVDNPSVFSAGYSGLDFNGRWLSTVNRFFQRANDLPGCLRKPAFVAPQFLLGSSLPGALRSPKQTRTDLSLHRSGRPRTAPVLALRPSSLP